MIKISTVDAAIDEDDEGIAERLGDLLDDAGEWDWSDGAEHEDRFGLLESSGAYWLVYRGTEGDTADRFASREEAQSELDEKLRNYEMQS